MYVKLLSFKPRKRNEQSIHLAAQVQLDIARRRLILIDFDLRQIIMIGTAFIRRAYLYVQLRLDPVILLIILLRLLHVKEQVLCRKVIRRDHDLRFLILRKNSHSISIDHGIGRIQNSIGSRGRELFLRLRRFFCRRTDIIFIYRHPGGFRKEKRLKSPEIEYK